MERRMPSEPTLRLHLSLLAAAGTLVFGWFSPTPARAWCVLGVGDTCPISESDAARLIRPHIDGKVAGRFSFNPTIASAVIWLNTVGNPGDGTPGPNAEGKRQIENADEAVRLISGSESCERLTSLFKSLGSRAKDCEFARFLFKRGMITVHHEIRPEVNPMRSVALFMRITPEGENQMKSYLLQRTRDNITVATHTLRFARVVCKPI
jgi:hypothetical protein